MQCAATGQFPVSPNARSGVITSVPFESSSRDLITRLRLSLRLHSPPMLPADAYWVPQYVHPSV